MRGWRGVLAWAGLLLGLTLPGLAGAQPAAKGLRFGPVPAWVLVQAVPLDAAEPEGGLSDGSHYLLADRQVRVAGSTLTDYHHVATRAVNESGVEDVANVQIRFDPSYQTLTIHRIEVRRGGKTVSRAAPDAVKLLQREASLESLIYDGRLTAHVALSDVRVGDVVETVYSLQGHNPVFGEHRFGSFDFAWSVPVAYRHARLLWPAGRPLFWKLYNGAQPAEVRQLGSEQEHRWALRDVPARVVDADSPGWHDPISWAEWGEFPDWAAVARWAMPLYRTTAGTMPAVDREVARIAAQTSDPEQRLLAALRFVQREVRYLGIEMGVNSHEPHRPEQVLRNRFGDCKDKTLLSLALLRGLGIAARPALVNTRERQAAAERLPTPWAFNHVIVQADLNGQRVWLDPTRRPQAGKGVAQWVQSDYGRALLVDADTTGLVPMAGPEARAQRREMHVLLDASAGFDQPATLTVTTRTYGATAEQLRETMATTARDRLQKEFLNYYGSDYPGLAVDKPLSVRDDTDANVLETVEHYRMPRYWVRDDKRARWRGELEVPDLLTWLRPPKALNRQDPLSLRHPVDLSLVSEFRLPGQWTLKPDQLVVEDSAFTMRRQEVWKGSTLTLNDRYLSRADHVPPQDVARYVANLEKARKGVGYHLYHSDEAQVAPEIDVPANAEDVPHWLPFSIGVMAWVVLLALLPRWGLWDPAPAPLAADVEPHAQIGGVLWLALLGIFLLPGWMGHLLFDTSPWLTKAGWNDLTRPGASAYHVLWAPTLLAGMVLELVVGALAAFTFWQLLNRRSSAPRWYAGVMLLAIAAVLFDVVMGRVIPYLREAWSWTLAAETLVQCAALAGGAVYMLHSGRVRRTCVVRCGQADLPAGPAPQSPSATTA